MYIDTVQIHRGPYSWTVIMGEQSRTSACFHHEGGDTSDSEEIFKSKQSVSGSGSVGFLDLRWRIYHREWWQMLSLLIQWQLLWFFSMMGNTVFTWMQPTGFLVTESCHGLKNWTTGHRKLQLHCKAGVGTSKTSFRVSVCTQQFPIVEQNCHQISKPL